MNIDRCVCCGEYVPEGQMVCCRCRKKVIVDEQSGFNDYGVLSQKADGIINRVAESVKRKIRKMNAVK